MNFRVKWILVKWGPTVLCTYYLNTKTLWKNEASHQLTWSMLVVFRLAYRSRQILQKKRRRGTNFARSGLHGMRYLCLCCWWVWPSEHIAAEDAQRKIEGWTLHVQDEEWIPTKGFKVLSSAGKMTSRQHLRHLTTRWQLLSHSFPLGLLDRWCCCRCCWCTWFASPTKSSSSGHIG